MARKTGGVRRVSALVVLAVALAVGTQARKLKSGGKKPNIIMFQPDDFPWITNQWPEAPQSQVSGNLLSIGNRNLDISNINRQGKTHTIEFELVACQDKYASVCS